MKYSVLTLRAAKLHENKQNETNLTAFGKPQARLLRENANNKKYRD